MISRFACLCLAAGLFASALGLDAQIPTPGPRPSTSPAMMPRPAGRSGDEMIAFFKLPEGDIDSVLDALSIYTGRTILSPGTLPTATYRLVINRPIPKSELVLALETILELNQVGVIPLGDRFLKVVALSQAKAEAPEFITGSTLDLPPSGRIATKLFELNFLRASKFFGGLNNIVSPTVGGGVVLLDEANSALVTDSITNLQRIETLVNAVDKPSAAGFESRFFTLNHAKATDVVTKLHSIFSGPAQNEVGSATYNADDRTNTVIILGHPDAMPIFESLITQLDLDSAPNTRNEVIYLQHADAKDVATILGQVVSGQNAAAQKSASQSLRPGEVNVPGQPQRPNATTPAGVSGGQGTNEFSSIITVTPDDRSNAIVVSGTVDDVRLIRELIAKLDIALAQVRIQVIIAEVTLSDTDISGISSLGLTVGQNAAGATHVLTFAGGTTTGTATAATTPGTSIAGWDLTGGVVNPLAFNAAFNPTSAGTKNLVHVLQAPVVVTAHNKQAEISVGTEQPIISGGQSTIATTGSSPVNSFTSTYQNIAIDLTVTPLVGENGDVQLTFDQKVDDVGGEVTIQAGDTQPIINHKEMKGFVTVKTGDMVVLGGLQETHKTATQNKIGFLYEIPIISQLLGGHTDDLERTELLFFVRPTILRPDETTADTKRRIMEMSNRAQVNQFLANPAPQPQSKAKNFKERFKTEDD